MVDVAVYKKCIFAHLSFVPKRSLPAVGMTLKLLVPSCVTLNALFLSFQTQRGIIELGFILSENRSLPAVGMTLKLLVSSCVTLNALFLSFRTQRGIIELGFILSENRFLPSVGEITRILRRCRCSLCRRRGSGCFSSGVSGPVR